MRVSPSGRNFKQDGVVRGRRRGVFRITRLPAAHPAAKLEVQAAVETDTAKARQWPGSLSLRLNSLQRSDAFQGSGAFMESLDGMSVSEVSMFHDRPQVPMAHGPCLSMMARPMTPGETKSLNTQQTL